MMLGETEQGLELGHWQQVLLLRCLGNELLLDVCLDGVLDLHFEKVKFITVYNALEPLVFENGLERGVGQFVLAFKPSPGGILVAVIKKLNHPTC